MCVSDAREHDEETTRSLQFGDRLRGVKNKVVMAEAVRNDEVVWNKSNVKSQIAKVKRELASMDGGGVDKSATNPAAVRKFHADVKRLEKMKGRIKLLEAEAYKAGMGRQANSPELKELRDSAKRLYEDVERVKGAVDRLTGKTFWREPSSGWKRKMEKIKELEGVLATL